VDDHLAIEATGLTCVFEYGVNARKMKAPQIWRTLLRIAGFDVDVWKGTGRNARRPVAALDGVSFAVEKGSIVCLRGPSRSGKSTLLKVLSGSLPPTGGRAALRGDVSSLLEISENLENSLTPRQTIASRAPKRGRSAASLPSPEDVIAFADLQGFEDVPSSKLSSGMQLRLSLAVALSGDPDILLLDDVLGTGDAAFQAKCFERLRQMKDQGKTIVFASDDPVLARDLATRVIQLERGKVVGDRHPADMQDEEDGSRFAWRIEPPGTANAVAALSAMSLDEAGDPEWPDLQITADFALSTAQSARPLVDISTQGRIVLRVLSPEPAVVTGPSTIRFGLRIPAEMLGPGSYWIEPKMVSTIGSQFHTLYALGQAFLRVNGAEQPGGPVFPVALACEAGPAPLPGEAA
jgi:ABC-type polysaccharide/polyol phosphate transport system ATPase subunit